MGLFEQPKGDFGLRGGREEDISLPRATFELFTPQGDKVSQERVGSNWTNHDSSPFQYSKRPSQIFLPSG